MTPEEEFKFLKDRYIGKIVQFNHEFVNNSVNNISELLGKFLVIPNYKNNDSHLPGYYFVVDVQGDVLVLDRNVFKGKWCTQRWCVYMAGISDYYFIDPEHSFFTHRKFVA